jgi:hypothetical protein
MDGTGVGVRQRARLWLLCGRNIGWEVCEHFPGGWRSRQRLPEMCKHFLCVGRLLLAGWCFLQKFTTGWWDEPLLSGRDLRTVALCLHYCTQIYLQIDWGDYILDDKFRGSSSKEQYGMLAVSSRQTQLLSVFKHLSLLTFHVMFGYLYY